MDERRAGGVEGRRSTARWWLAGLIVALAVGSIAYRLLVFGKLQQSAALFVGVPALLALVLALFARPASLTGLIMLGTTIALLMSGILLGEGFVCVVMASPIFYLIAALVAMAAGSLARRRAAGRPPGPGAYGLAIAPFLLLSLEGVHEWTSLPRAETVVAERVVAGRPAEVERALAQAPRFQRELSEYLRIGFPRPVGADGEGLRPGDRRTVRFVGGSGRPRELVLEVAEREAGRVLFRAVSDQTKIAEWLTWREAEVRWSAVDGERTRVTWTFHYERRLDPAWYFGPWERYAVGLAAEYLIASVATPAE